MKALALARLAILGSVALSACRSGVPAPAAAAAPKIAEHVDDGDQPADTSAPSAGTGTPTPAAGCTPSCAKLIDDAERRRDQADAMKNEADTYPAFATRAGEAFVKAWRGCLLEIPDGADLACKGGRHVVSNMVGAFAPSDSDEGMILANLVALDPRWAADASWAGDQRTALRAAAGRAEKAVAKDARAELLTAAAYARLALDDASGAAHDAAAHRQKFPKDKTGSLFLGAAIAGWYNDRSDFAAALAALGQPPGPNDDAHVSIVWHAEHGRALAGSKRTDQARAELDAVIAAWPTDQNAAIKIAGQMAPRPMPDREGAVDAVASALFFRADQKRVLAQALAPPRYAGPGTAASFSQFVTTRVAEWAGKKQPLIQDAVAAYKQIAATQPGPSRRWLTLAAARTGQLFASYVDQFKGIAVPPAVANDAQARAAYDKAVQSSIAPVIEAARGAFTTCTTLAKRSRIENDDTRACEKWTEKNAR
jgi:hypothetical protein